MTDSPRARLLRLLSDPGAQERVTQATRILGGSCIPLWFLQAGIGAPPGRTLEELIPGLLRMGHRAVSAEEPTFQPSGADLYVMTDEQRVPTEIGFVVRPVFRALASGPALVAFEAATDCGPQRIGVEAVDFWFRAPT